MTNPYSCLSMLARLLHSHLQIGTMQIVSQSHDIYLLMYTFEIVSVVKKHTQEVLSETKVVCRGAVVTTFFFEM
jgi:hypothetical protein